MEGTTSNEQKLQTILCYRGRISLDLYDRLSFEVTLRPLTACMNEKHKTLDSQFFKF